jgi:hypothetical protein
MSLFLILLTIVAISTLVAGVLRVLASPKRRGAIALANIISVGIWPNGVRSYASEGVIGRYALVKRGTNKATQVLVCGAADIPLGITRDEAAGAGQDIGVRMLGATPGSEIGVCDAAIAIEDRLVPATTAGRLRKLPAAAGTYYVVGVALSLTNNAGEQVEFVPCTPYPVVVP